MAHPASPVAGAPTPLPFMGDALFIYFRDMSRFPLLTRAEEITLARQVQLGDREALDRMVTANLRLVVKVARDYEYFGLPLLDLISEGNIGLVKAVNRFDPDRGIRFSAYACHWIKHFIRRALANHTRTIRLPVHVNEKLFHISQVAHRLQHTLGRPPTEEEISDETGLRPAQIRRFREAAHPAVSLDHCPSDGEGSTLAEKLGDSVTPTPDAAVELASDLKLMRERLGGLEARDRYVIERRFGLDGEPESTLAEISDEIGVSRERVRQIQEAALQELRRLMKKADSQSVVA